VEVVPGSYPLMVLYHHDSGYPYDPSLAIPYGYTLYSDSAVTITTDTDLGDIILPAKRVDVHVQDPAGNPVPNVMVGTNAPSNNDLMIGNIPARGHSSYPWYFPKTDASGNATLWLFPTSTGSYAISATPPTGAPFAPFSLQGVTVTSNKSLFVVLQFVHPPPDTQALLSPAVNHDGTFPDPVTVSLSANAASGFTIDATYYSVNGGPQQTYSGPFVVSGEGDHIIEYWSIDDAGVYETPKTKTFTIRNPFTDLSISASDLSFSPAVPDPGQPVTIKAKVRNLGLTDSADVLVEFADFGDALGQVTIPSLSAGGTIEVSVVTTYSQAGLRLISVKVDPYDTISELNEDNNEASKVLQVGEPDFSTATMVVTASSPSTCQGNYLSINGQAYYDFTEVPGTNDHPVQGGRLTVTVLDPATNQSLATYSGATTTVYGNYSQGIIAPSGDGTYPVLISLTDKTITQETQTALTVSGACQVTPPAPPPPPGDTPPPPPPSIPPGSSPTAIRDLYVRSQDIYFSDDNPDPGEAITLFAYIHYFGDEPVFDVPVTFNDIFPIDGVLRSFPIATSEVSFANGSGTAVVIVPWTGNIEGAHVIQAVIDPPFDQNTRNDKATRLIVVGNPPQLEFVKSVALLVDADGNGTHSPGDTLEYTISYNNTGTTAVTGAVISDDYDEALLDGPVQVSGSGTDSGGVLTWNLGDLAAGASGSVSYQVDILPASDFPLGRTTIHNFALLSTNEAPAVATEANIEVLVNVPPTVNAGPDRTVDEGSTITLTAVGSDFEDGELIYAWDLDGDGNFETFGQNVNFHADDGPATHVITVQVTDPGGLSATDQITVTVLNVAPRPTSTRLPPATRAAISHWPSAMSQTRPRQTRQRASPIHMIARTTARLRQRTSQSPRSTASTPTTAPSPCSAVSKTKMVVSATTSAASSYTMWRPLSAPSPRRSIPFL
jgi:hypothetical protein